MPLHSASLPRLPRASLLLAPLLLAAILGPAISWLEFSNGSELLHTATVLEIRRGGAWLVPTLNGKPRLAKPPLPAWIGALCVSDAAMGQIASPDAATCDAGYRRLQWEIRWPALLAGAFMVLASADLGRTLGNRRVGFCAALVAASCYLFLNNGRVASTDIHLALWVALANALLARAIFRGQRWTGAVGAGIAIGLGCMCKGPVALLQTVVPLLPWWLLVRQRQRTADSVAAPRRWALPAAACVVAMLAVALPWPVLVLTTPRAAVEGERRTPAQLWWAEITREGATDHDYDSVFTYLSLVPDLLPWLPVFLLGAGLTFRHLRRHRRFALAISWLIIPILVMSLPRDKQDRYLLPMLPAAAVLAGRGCVAAAAGARRGWRGMRMWFGTQVLLIVIVALIAPLGGTFWLRNVDQGHWFSLSIGVAALATALVASMLLFWVARRWPLMSVAAGGAITLAAAALMLWGYKDAADGRAEMKPLADQVRALRPGAAVAFYEPHKQPRPAPSDLAIYMNQATPTIRAEHGKPPSVPESKWPPVLVALQREQEQPPHVPGWHTLTKAKYLKRTWHALERD